jgi:hypothetical protein
MVLAITDETYREIIDGIVEVISQGSNQLIVKEDLVNIYKPYIMSLGEAKVTLDQRDLKGKELDQLSAIMDIVKVITRSAFSNLNPTNIPIMSEIFSELWGLIKYFFLKLNVSMSFNF